jgi:myo-inositol 2-dehydrogenase/D-chiro-inositol 1-dehydrogenase
MIRFGILGAGRIGKVHTATIGASKVAKVAYVADAVAKAASDLAATVGAKTASVEEIIAAKDVDAILIATPTGTHADLIEAASNAGKAILCEKPVSLSVERILSCLKVVEKNKSNLMIGFNRRFDPNFAALEKRIRSGDIGTVELATIISRDPAPPPVEYIKRSGGLFRDMMIHDLDMARWLLAAEPVEVFARGSALADPAIGTAGDVDTAMVMLRTASGQLCQIANSRRCSFGYDQRIEAFGSKGMVRADNHTATSVTVAGDNGFNTEPALPFFLERYADAYRLELDDFINALDKQRVELATGDDGWRALLLADAAQRSLTSGAPVALK